MRLHLWLRAAFAVAQELRVDTPSALGLLRP